VKRLVIAALLAACAGFAADAQTVSPYPPLTIPLKINQVPDTPVCRSPLPATTSGIAGQDDLEPEQSRFKADKP
jgi:hypothetical protein